MNCTLNKIPELGRLIYIRDGRGGLEISRFPMKNRRPYTGEYFTNWWTNYSDQRFFSHWDYVSENVESLLLGKI